MVPAQVNGQDAKLIFDTGAANYITPSVARARGLEVSGGITIGGVGTSSETGGFAQIGRLSIGGATLRDTATIVGPLPYAATHPRPGLILDGLTGWEFLTEFQTTIDYPRKTITFGDGGQLPSETATIVPFRTDGYTIFIELIVSGQPGWFRLDTGDPGTITVFETFAKEAQIVERNEATVTEEMGGALRYGHATFDDIRLGDLTLPSVEGQVAHQAAGAFGLRSVAGNIGAGLLAPFRVTIDFRSKTVTITP